MEFGRREACLTTAARLLLGNAAPLKLYAPYDNFPQRTIDRIIYVIQCLVTWAYPARYKGARFSMSGVQPLLTMMEGLPDTTEQGGTLSVIKVPPAIRLPWPIVMPPTMMA